MTHLTLHLQWSICNFWLYIYMLVMIQHFKELYVFKVLQVTFIHNTWGCCFNFRVQGSLGTGVTGVFWVGQTNHQRRPQSPAHATLTFKASVGTLTLQFPPPQSDKDSVAMGLHCSFSLFSSSVLDASFSFKAATQLSEVWLQWSEGRQILINFLLISALQNHSLRKNRRVCVYRG